MSTIIINGRVITGGQNVNIVGNRVFVDGRDVTPDSKDIRIEVNGNLESLSADSCSSINVSGTVGNVSTQAGNVKCGNVFGSVKTMAGDVHCGTVGGDVKTMSGDIIRQ